MSTRNPSSHPSHQRGPEAAYRPRAAAFLAWLTVSLLILGLLPPWYGAIAFAVAVGTGVAAQAQSGLALPKHARYSALVVLIVMCVVVVVATVNYFTTPTYDNPATAPSEDNIWGALVLIAVYEIAVIVTLVSAVRYARAVQRAGRPSPE